MPIIDDEFKFLVPDLSQDEFDLLEKNIKSNGCLSPILLWNDIIIDGHNRYAICTKNNISYETRNLEFENRNAVVNWIIENQLGRRNLSDTQKSYLRGKKYEAEKIVSLNNKDTILPRVSVVDIREKIAEESGKSPTTIYKDYNAAIGIDEIKNINRSVAQKVIAEEIKIPKRELETFSKKPDYEKIEIVKEIANDNTLTIKEAEKKVEEKAVSPKFNLTNDNIEWSQYTWNPVTGCKMGCVYCYARDIANRFYDNGFEPTFHEDRLDAPIFTKLPSDTSQRHVFVCSMADLFGDWVPDVWIEKILDSVRASPAWTFIFLTKNPKRLIEIDWPKNAWIGTTVDVQSRVEPAISAMKNVKATVRFISCEPLQEELTFSEMPFEWIIIGGRSRSSGMEAGQPEWTWVEKLLTCARQNNVKVYFKPNLASRPKEYPME